MKTMQSVFFPDLSGFITVWFLVISFWSEEHPDRSFILSSASVINLLIAVLVVWS